MTELKGKIILVVEDNKTVNRQLTAILTKYGAIVLQAETGSEALEKAAEKPDMILMDVQMPGMNGYEATQIIKKTKDLENIPVIMLTGNKEGEDVENSIIYYVFLTNKICKGSVSIVRP